MSDLTRIRILENLVIRYQKTTDPKVFAQILAHVDMLLCKTCHKLKRANFYLITVEFCDLYQTSIIGLRDAINTAKMDSSSEKIIPRILAYVKSNIQKTYKYNCREFPISSEYVYEDRAQFISVNEDCEELYDMLKWLYKKEMLSDKDLVLINLRYVKQMTYKDIGNLSGVKPQAVHFQLNKIIKRIQIQYNK